MELHFTHKQVMKAQSRNVIQSTVCHRQCGFEHNHEHSHSIWHDNKRLIVELIRPKEFYMSRRTWAISYLQTIGNIYVGCGYASTLTMSTRPAVNVVVKFGKIISYFDFLTDCLHAATSIPHHQNESHSNGPSSWV